MGLSATLEPAGSFSAGGKEATWVSDFLCPRRPLAHFKVHRGVSPAELLPSAFRFGASEGFQTFPVFLEEQCIHLPRHFVEAPQVSHDLGGRRQEVVFVRAKMNQLDLGGKNDLAVSAANGESGVKDAFRAAPNPALGGFPKTVPFRVHTQVWW